MAAEEQTTAPDPDFPSGEWLGFYQDGGSAHRQEMHLTFGSGRMTGAGADDIGPFTIAGGYDSTTKEAWWTKTYPGSHSVFYKGYREVKGIWGRWEITPARDGFHIWPRAHGEGAGREARCEHEVPTMVSTPPRVPATV